MERMTSRRYKTWLVVGALFGAFAVVCGAFGAHGLRSALERGQVSATSQVANQEQIIERRLENWETAARYQMYHALALLAVGWLASHRCTLAIHLAGTAMTFGTLIFSGCLYVVVLTGETWLGRIVPIGGGLMIVGWICLAYAALTYDKVGPAGPAGPEAV
jgi:uncharacterized membrane protein YgdD (TMEM256/DUF423 family)